MEAQRLTTVYEIRDELSAGLATIEKQLDGFKGKFEESTEGVNGFGEMLKDAGATAVGFLAAMAGRAGIGGAFDAIKAAAIGLNSELEQTRIGFGTMLGSAQEADLFIRDMAAFAARTPFAFSELTEAAKRMMALGFAADEVKPLLTAVGDATSALGTGSEGIDRITTALGQMSSKTKVSADEMLQLTEAGIPAWRLLAEAMGTSVAQVQKLAEQGKISADVFIKAFQDFSKANFGGLMEANARTFQGAINTISDSLQMAIANGSQPLFESLRDIAVAIADLTSSDAFRLWIADLSGGFREVIDILKTEWAPAWQAFVEGFDVEGDPIRNFFLDLATGFLRVERFLNRPPDIRPGEDWPSYVKRAWDEAGQAAFDARQKIEAAGDAARRKAAEGIEGDPAAKALREAQKAQDALDASTATYNEELTKSGEKIDDLKDRIADLADSQSRTLEDSARNIARTYESLRLSLKAMDASQRANAESLAELEADQGQRKAAEHKKDVDRLAEIDRLQQMGSATREEADALQAEREQTQARIHEQERAFARQGEYGRKYNDLLQELGKATTEAQRDAVMAQIKEVEKQEKKEKDGYDTAFALERQKTVNQIAETQIRKQVQAEETAQRIGDIERERDRSIEASNNRMLAITGDLAKEQKARQDVIDKLDAEKAHVNDLMAAYDKLAQRQRLAGLMGAIESGNAVTPMVTGRTDMGPQPVTPIPGPYVNPIIPSTPINPTIGLGGTSDYPFVPPVGTAAGNTNTFNVQNVTISPPRDGETPPDWFQRWQASIISEANAERAGRR